MSTFQDLHYLSNLKPHELIPIFDSISDAIFIDDDSGKALWINKACEDLFKIQRSEILGKNITSLEKEGIFTPSVARLVMEQKKAVNLIHQNKDGKRILSTGIPLLDEAGNITKIITTSRDVTELISLQNKLEDARLTLDELKARGKIQYDKIIANSPSMYQVIQFTERLADVDSTVLITGESGVGKGVIARLIHDSGKRKDHPFVKINCGAIPENLIESELFGYESGAFTGSRTQGKTGLFEEAEGGTVFLDEISELPLNMQVKLLQVIQEREIKKVGGVKTIPVNVRIISATNKDLEHMVQSGQFREDLFYRLNVVPVNIPPLRERPEDVIPMIRYFLNKNNKKMQEHKSIDSNAMAILIRYSWPGNVRELENIIERVVITTREETILPENLPSFLMKSAKPVHDFSVLTDENLKEALEQAEKKILASAFAKYRSTRKIAVALGVSQPTIVRRLQKYQIIQDDTK